MNFGSIEKEAGYETARGVREVSDKTRELEQRVEKLTLLRRVGKIQIGDVERGNYIEISQNGVERFGTSREWQDIRISSTAVKAAGTDDPGFEVLRDNLRVWKFAGTGPTTENLYFEMQLPHGVDTSEPLQPHLHWAPTTADSGNVKWFFEYTICDVDDAFPAATTLSVVQAAGGQYNHQIAGFDPDIDISGVGDSAVLLGRVYRDPTDGDDTYGADAAFLSFDFHYLAKKDGSADPIGERPA